MKSEQTMEFAVTPNNDQDESRKVENEITTTKRNVTSISSGDNWKENNQLTTMKTLLLETTSIYDDSNINNMLPVNAKKRFDQNENRVDCNSKQLNQEHLHDEIETRVIENISTQSQTDNYKDVNKLTAKSDVALSSCEAELRGQNLCNVLNKMILKKKKKGKLGKSEYEIAMNYREVTSDRVQDDKENISAHFTPQPLETINRNKQPPTGEITNEKKIASPLPVLIIRKDRIYEMTNIFHPPFNRNNIKSVQFLPRNSTKVSKTVKVSPKYRSISHRISMEIVRRYKLKNKQSKCKLKETSRLENKENSSMKDGNASKSSDEIIKCIETLNKHGGQRTNCDVETQTHSYDDMLKNVQSDINDRVDQIIHGRFNSTFELNADFVRLQKDNLYLHLQLRKLKWKTKQYEDGISQQNTRKRRTNGIDNVDNYHNERKYANKTPIETSEISLGNQLGRRLDFIDIKEMIQPLNNGTYFQHNPYNEGNLSFVFDMLPASYRKSSMEMKSGHYNGNTRMSLGPQYRSIGMANCLQNGRIETYTGPRNRSMEMTTGPLNQGVAMANNDYYRRNIHKYFPGNVSPFHLTPNGINNAYQIFPPRSLNPGLMQRYNSVINNDNLNLPQLISQPIPNTYHYRPIRPKTGFPKLKTSISTSGNVIILTWDYDYGRNSSVDYRIIDCYNLYTHCANIEKVDAKEWKKIGVIHSFPLPMACTLTQFIEGHIYYFAITSMDSNGMESEMSKPCFINLN